MFIEMENVKAFPYLQISDMNRDDIYFQPVYDVQVHAPPTVNIAFRAP